MKAVDVIVAHVDLHRLVAVKSRRDGEDEQRQQQQLENVDQALTHNVVACLPLGCTHGSG